MATATAAVAAAAAEGRGRQKASPDHLPVPPRPRSRHRHRAAVRPQFVGTPPRPAPGPRHAQGQGTAAHRPILLPHHHRARPARPFNGSPFAALLYLCAALGVAMDSCGSLRAYLGLAAAVVAALIIALLRSHPPRLVDQRNPDGLAAPAPAPQTQQKQHRIAPTITINGNILDAAQVAAVIRSSMEDSTRLIPAVSPPPADSSDSDGGGSSTNGDEINSFWYTPVLLLKAGDVCLVLPDFIQQLQDMDPGLTEAEYLELLQTAFRDANESGGFQRLSDIVEENRWIIYDGLHVLTDRSTGTSVMTMKITAKLIQLIWSELDGQNWKSCQDVKKECCFQVVVRQSVEELLDVALSLSNTRWSVDHPLQMLTILDALVDVLYTVRELTFSSTEFMHDVVAHVFYKMVVDLRGMLEGTTSYMHSISESAIHPATVLVVRYLEFFHRNRDMMQFVLGDCAIELSLIHAWVSKLSEDAEAMFPAKGQRYIYMLNNMDFVYQLKDHPGGCLSSVELQRGLCSLIHQYIQSYLEECWVPLVGYLGVDSRKIFLEEFFTICDSQMEWKVRTVLRGTLRREIAGLIVPYYVNFLQENPTSNRPSWLKARSEKPTYTAAWLKKTIGEFFEG